MSSTTQRPAQLQEVGERGYSRWKWRVLIGAMLCYLFFYTGRQTFGFAIPGIEEEFGVDKAALGWVSAALLWCYAAGQAINGNLADKFGGRKLMTLGAILSTILNWATSFAIGVKSLGLFWGLNGYVQAMGWPSGGRVISNWWGPHERGRAFGFYTLAAGPIMIFMALGAICAMTMFLAPLGTVAGIAVLFLTGFFVYGPQSSFRALCPDLAGKRLAWTATGIVNFFSYLFAGFGEPLIGSVVDHTGNTALVFPIVAGACVASAVMASLIRR